MARITRRRDRDHDNDTGATIREPNVVIRRRLEAIGGRVIMVPGCEPTSAQTSITLSANMKGVCNSSTVGLQAALAAIPGSYLEFGVNSGGLKQIWFVLPDFPVDCCDSGLDWYKILRDLPPEPHQVEERYECGTLYQGFCPSDDFKLGRPDHSSGPLPPPLSSSSLYGGDGPPMPSTYVPEGTNIVQQFYNPELGGKRFGVPEDQSSEPLIHGHFEHQRKCEEPLESNDPVFMAQVWCSEGGKWYSVPGLCHWASEHLELKHVDLSELKHIVSGVDTDEFVARANEVNIQYPILLTKRDGVFHTIDGRHRIWKSLHLGFNLISAHIVDVDMIPDHLMVN